MAALQLPLSRSIELTICVAFLSIAKPVQAAYLVFLFFVYLSNANPINRPVYIGNRRWGSIALRRYFYLLRHHFSPV